MNPAYRPTLRLVVLFAVILSGCAIAESTAAPTISPTTSRTLPPAPTAIIPVGQHSRTTTVQVEGPSQALRMVQLRYLLYLPESYGKNLGQKFPLLLFLHGRGERGANLEMLKKHPLPKLLEDRTDFPFIVVSPQQSLEELWWSDLIDPLKGLLDQLEATYAVDSERVYLTGLSMGGFGAWEFALKYPDRFAAVVPIAGGFREASHAAPENICNLRDIPIWAFHGTADEYVQAFQSQVLAEALQECGGNVRLTLYEGVDHEGSWTRAYADPELYQWLLAQRRSTR